MFFVSIGSSCGNSGGDLQHLDHSQSHCREATGAENMRARTKVYGLRRVETLSQLSFQSALKDWIPVFCDLNVILLVLLGQFSTSRGKTYYGATTVWGHSSTRNMQQHPLSPIPETLNPKP